MSAPPPLHPHYTPRIIESYLGEINTKRINLQSVQKCTEALAEPAHAFLHELQIHKVCVEVGEGIGELGELWGAVVPGEGVGGEVGGCGVSAEGIAGGAAEGCGGAGRGAGTSVGVGGGGHSCGEGGWMK